MKKTKFTRAMIEKFSQHLYENEKSAATIEKYVRDVSKFYDFMQKRSFEKSSVLDYKAYLEKNYATTSANSMLASLNSFLRFIGADECTVKQFKIQKNPYCPEQKELTRKEYLQLVFEANKKNSRLALLIQTICATGIRVSEIRCITVEAVKSSEATVSCKGKIRKIFIVSSLKKKLDIYIKKQRLCTGPIFVTKSGRVLDRSNIWREMKSLCEKAGVLPDKVFPHNLRHLFARTFYQKEKDISALADVLGHSNINTTRIYMISSGAEHRRRMESMHLII